MVRQRTRFSLLILALMVGATPPLMGEGSNDRRQNYEEAENEGNKKTEEQLRPRQQMHDMKKQEHLQKAEEARSRQDFGTAQQEEQMAMMEQMKSQQLDQQINKNKETAKKNQDSADKLSKNEKGSQGEQLGAKGYDANVVSVRKGTGGTDAKGDTKPTSPQLASFDDFEQPTFPDVPPPPVILAPPEPPPAPASTGIAPTLIQELEDVSQTDRFSIGYRDDTPGRSSSSDTPNLSQDQPQTRLIAAATGGSSSGGGSIPISSKSETNPQGEERDPNAVQAGGEATGETSGGQAGSSLTSLAGSTIVRAKVTPGPLDKDFFVECPIQPKVDEKIPAHCKKMREMCKETFEDEEGEEEATEGEGKAAQKVASRDERRPGAEAEEDEVPVSEKCKAWRDKRKEVQKAERVKKTLDRIRKVGSPASKKTARRPGAPSRSKP